jgi:hypothetical protein
MILIADVAAALVQLWKSHRPLTILVPGGLWMAGAVPSTAPAPYASFTLVEAETENGSNFIIRRYDLVVTVWSDQAAERAGEIARAVEEWLDINPKRLQIHGGTVLRVRNSKTEQEVTPEARNANDVTITRLQRRIVIHEQVKHGS